MVTLLLIIMHAVLFWVGVVSYKYFKAKVLAQKKAKALADRKAKCPVCQSWHKSVTMMDDTSGYARGWWCDEHKAQYLRIRDLEVAVLSKPEEPKEQPRREGEVRKYRTQWDAMMSSASKPMPSLDSLFEEMALPIASRSAVDQAKDEYDYSIYKEIGS